MLTSYLAIYARWIVGGVFLLAGVAKARDRDEFASTIELFRLLPRRGSTLAAPLIIGLELILGTSLLIGVGVEWTALAAVMLLGIFALAVLVNLVRRNIVDCGSCGPYFQEKISVKTLGRNSSLMVLGLVVARFDDGYFALESWWSGHPAVPSDSVGSFLLLTAVLVVGGISALTIQTVLKDFKAANRSNSR